MSVKHIIRAVFLLEMSCWNCGYNSVVAVTVGYTMNTIYLGWLSNPIELDAGIGLHGFELTDKFIHDCSQNYTTG